MHEPDYIPRPTILLEGCQCWPPRPGPDGRCPACRGRIKPADLNVYCLVCDSMAPRREAQVLAARHGLDRKSRAAAAVVKARGKLQEQHLTILSERERRRIWHGARNSYDTDADVVNRAKIGRDWLKQIGQEPDWSISLARGARRA